MKFLMLMLGLSVIQVGNCQVNVSGFSSTSKTRLTGMDFTVRMSHNVVLGIGGSYCLNTYNGTGAKDAQGLTYAENIHLPHGMMNAQGISSKSPLRPTDVYQYMVEDRGTVVGLVGFTTNSRKTTLLIEGGLDFRTQYWLCKGQSVPLNHSNPNGLYFTYDKMAPKTLIGISAQQTISGRLGIMAGYNNVEKAKFGLTYRITPTKMFK